MGRITRRIRIHRITHTDPTVNIRGRADVVGVEEPLEMRVGGESFTTTMRTPGHDMELAHGFLYSEGLIHARQDIASMRYCSGAQGPDGLNTYNVLDIHFAAHMPPPAPHERRATLTTSACGVCGTASIEQVMSKSHLTIPNVTFDPTTLLSLPDILRQSQQGFETTGGMHGAGLFTPDGQLLCLREDVGRHNAVDKIIGHLVMSDGLPPDPCVLVVSSRASFELVQKNNYGWYPSPRRSVCRHFSSS